jgi:hypothetical protein
MEYFGTSLDVAGHYRVNIDNGFDYHQSLKFNDLPFNPEQLTNGLPRGDVVFYQGGGYTVIGIAGSCKDQRPGTKSIFWVKEIISRDEMIHRIVQNETAMKIINAMPFEVKF